MSAETDRINQMAERVAERARRIGSGEFTPAHPLVEIHGHRIGKLEDRVDHHDHRLSAGDIGFAELRKDVCQLTSAVGDLTAIVKWVGLGICGTVGIAILATVVRHP